ncbi:hypothetical protein LOK49_LG10G02970 [Camellia lanceoleosa]|uniref:Uncharacterized protein n=1 Tax=Camellia lanceoleosa TaxID=1840588 RepID=A0ACC0GAK4_9ERIC|nr:hypothetical protein LOK49_LG10G02970 [Camellia lanceoleosa]
MRSSKRSNLFSQHNEALIRNLPSSSSDASTVSSSTSVGIRLVSAIREVWRLNSFTCCITSASNEALSVLVVLGSKLRSLARFYGHLNCATATSQEEQFGDQEAEIELQDIEINPIPFPVTDESVNLIAYFLNLGGNKRTTELNHCSHEHPLVLFDKQITDEFCSESKPSLPNFALKVNLLSQTRHRIPKSAMGVCTRSQLHFTIALNAGSFCIKVVPSYPQR